MSDLCYAPLIRDMTWSFSRVSSFDSCPYRWFLHYIKGKREDDTFYASYGSFMHRILARYYAGEIERDGLAMEFLTGFRKEVKGMRPAASTVEKYVKEGAEYLRHPFTPEGKVLGVEMEVKFSVEGIPFVGFIDLVTREGGGIVLTDHKSRVIKSEAEAREMMKQLYLYSAAVFEETGEFPSRLRFNCFRDGKVIEIPFDPDEYAQSIRWVSDTIRKIESSEDFDPNPDWFRCRYLCGFRDFCGEWEG